MTINSRFSDFSCICESQPFSVFLAFSPSIETSVLFWCGFSAFCHSLTASMRNGSEFYWQRCHWRTLYCNSNLFINDWTMLLCGALSMERERWSVIRSDHLEAWKRSEHCWCCCILGTHCRPPPSRWPSCCSTTQRTVTLSSSSPTARRSKLLVREHTHTRTFKINDFVQPHTFCPSLTLWCFIFRTFWFKSCRFCWNQSCWWVKQTKPQTFISVSLSGVFVFASAGEILRTNSWFWI